MKWEVQINGDTLDLKELSKSLVDDELRVLEKNGQYFLESNRFEEITNSEEVASLAADILKVLTGAARLSLGGRTPLHVANTARVRTDEGREMMIPVQPKIYHIVHVDRLPSIIADGYLWCDAEIGRRVLPGTTIGMNDIKQRRLNELVLTSHPSLHVGDCVPFYFCPRSIMLYLIHRGNNSEMVYRGRQGHILHLEADLHASVAWSDQNNRCWAFTLSNAGAYYFEDRCDLMQLNEINWEAVQTNRWSGNGIASSVKEGKQAEFLLEHSFPWHLIKRIGVHSRVVYQQVANVLSAGGHRPQVEIKTEWYC